MKDILNIVGGYKKWLFSSRASLQSTKTQIFINYYQVNNVNY